MENLIKRLLSGKTVRLFKRKGMLLPSEEKEKLYDILEVDILKGEVASVIVAYLVKEVKKEGGTLEEYHREEIYRLPFVKDYAWLKITLEELKKQSHSYFANRV